MTMVLHQKIAVLTSVVGLITLGPLLAHAADQSTSDRANLKNVAAPSAVASGAVEDSLKACLARIPKDASAGQRMMAEQSCQRDEESRQPFESTRIQ